MKRWLVALFVVLVGVLVSVPGCSKKTSSQSGDVALTKEAPESTAGGVVWSYPSKWTKAGPRAMRVVTYTVAAAQWDAEGENVLYRFSHPGREETSKATFSGGADNLRTRQRR